MLNYCIFLILWSILVLLGMAFFLALVLHRAFRTPLGSPAPTRDPAQAASDPSASEVLNYAPAPVRHPILHRQPRLAAVGAFIIASALLAMAAAPTIIARFAHNALGRHALAAMCIGTLALIACGILAFRALHRTCGIPAAAQWPRRRLLNTTLLLLLAIVATLVRLDLATRHRMQELRAMMDAQSHTLYPPLPAGHTNPVDTYRESLNPLLNLPVWTSRYSSLTTAPTAPPSLSASHQNIALLIREATQSPRVDWGIAPTISSMRQISWDFWAVSEAAQFLRIHAALEAKTGHADSAINDILALRQLARHAGQTYITVGGTIAKDIEAISCETTGDVLPLITDERLLDRLTVSPDDWHQLLRVRIFQGEQTLGVLTLIDAYEGNWAGLLTWTTRSSRLRLICTRVFTADADLTTTHHIYDQVIAIARKPATQALPEMRQLSAQLPTQYLNGGSLCWGVIPDPVRAITMAIEAETLGQLNNVGLAARRYHLRTGHLPATLDDLVSTKLLNEIPTDPFSGQPILLKAENDQIIIYSVGPDGRDDGGNYITNKDTTFRLGTKPLWEIDAATAQADQAATDQKEAP